MQKRTVVRIVFFLLPITVKKTEENMLLVQLINSLFDDKSLKMKLASLSVIAGFFSFFNDIRLLFLDCRMAFLAEMHRRTILKDLLCFSHYLGSTHILNAFGRIQMSHFNLD